MVRTSFLHHVDKAVEEVGAVLGAGGAFRMVLDAEHMVFFTFHTFYRLVQQVYVGYLQGRMAHTVRVHRVGMVLGGDFNPAGFQIPDRMVSAPVAKFQLISPGPAGQGKNLMPQADPENGIFSDQLSNGPDRFRHILRVSRAIGDQHPVWVAAQDLPFRGVPGNDSNPAVPLHQGADDIPLGTAVNQNYMMLSFRIQLLNRGHADPGHLIPGQGCPPQKG